MTRGRCPVCGKPPLAEFRPFCSARCADVDLNRWLTGGYSIIADEMLEEDEKGPSDPPDVG